MLVYQLMPFRALIFVKKKVGNKFVQNEVYIQALRLILRKNKQTLFHSDHSVNGSQLIPVTSMEFRLFVTCHETNSPLIIST